MKWTVFAIAVLPLAGAAPGNPVDRAVLAAMRVGEQRSYGWHSLVVDDARSYMIEGKTQAGGYTWVRLPMVATVAERLGRADQEIEAIFKGCTRAVIRTDHGWRTLGELPKRRRGWNEDGVVLPVSRSSQPLWTRDGPAAVDPWGLPPIALAPGASSPPEEGRPYCNAQFGLAHPHDELAIIVSSYATLEVRGEVATGTLSDLGARLLLVRDGQEHIAPLCAAGTFKLFLNNGLVTRYLLRLEGFLAVERKRVHVRQASNTILRDIGVTRFSVPEEAQRKLGR